jgi:carbohydrate-selective porin OprB
MNLEILYNIAATHWLYVTPDIQVIEPAGKRATTAFLTGLRLRMKFEPAYLRGQVERWRRPSR